MVLPDQTPHKPRFGQKVWRGMKRVAKDFDAQVWNRQGPMGASELANVLYSGNAFVLYGHNGSAMEQKPSEMVHGPEIKGQRM